MNSMLQLLVLAGIAVFLIVKLRGVLGTREGFEKPPVSLPTRGRKPALEVIDGGPDRDITDHVPDGSPSARALAGMKTVEGEFSVSEFLKGARGAYELILMAFDRGDLESIRAFLAPEVYDAFDSVVQDRRSKGLRVESTFVGIADIGVKEATFDHTSREAELSVKFVAETTSAVRDAAGEIVEGSTTAIKRQRDVWTFARTMGSNDPNWLLVATSE
jgi:predicted lipid-binding transport protein (Tim44 family)